MVCIYFNVWWRLCGCVCVGGERPRQETHQRKCKIAVIGLSCRDRGTLSVRLSAAGLTVILEGKDDLHFTVCKAGRQEDAD